MGVEITPVVVRVAHSLFAFPEVSFPQIFALCDEKRFPFPGLRQLFSHEDGRRELIEQVAEETTLAHARQFAEQNEDNWIISEELLLPFSLGRRTQMDGNLSLRVVINYDEGYQAPTGETSTGLSYNTCLNHGESLHFLPY